MGSQPLPAQRARLIALGLRPSAWQSSRPVSGRGQGRSRRRRGRAAPALSPADRRSTSSTVAVWGGTGRDIDLIWVRREQKYFCRQDWTASISLNRFNKSSCIVIARSASPLGGLVSPTGPRMARPDDRLRRNPPVHRPVNGGLRLRLIHLRAFVVPAKRGDL